jgi:hypothetical protein
MNVSNINDLAEVGSLLIVGATTVEVRTWVPFPLEEHEFGVASDTTSGSDTDQDNPELAIVETRVPELELPTRLSLTFATNDIKETEVTVSYSRNTHPLYKSTPVIGESSMDIPLVMSTSAAKHIVKKYLSRLWTERSSYEYTMGFRFTLLNVADVIEIPFNSLNQFVRITDVAEVSPNIRGYKAVEIHAQFNDLTTSDSADTQPSDQLLQRRAKTIGGILDTHVFRPSDDNLGWYTACYSYPPARPWEGANIKHGRFPILLSTIGSIAVQAAFGTLISDLPDNSPEGTFDESLIIQVQMKSNDTLTSHTFEEVLNGANLALIGNEFISFKTATLVAGKIYDLSGILRYRMGTKPLAGEHVYGERFIVVTPSTVSRILANSDDIGVRHYFKFVTDGLQAKNQTLLSQLFTGRSLICHAPSPYPDHYTPYDASKHHIYLCFGYVSRIGGDLVDGFDTPNSEPEANYEIDVYKTSDDTLLRTITATNHNIEAAMTEGASGEGVYFDDDQIADLGHLAVSEEVYFKIYQISAVMGRGYPLTITFYK